MSIFRVRTRFTGPQGAPWLNTLYFEETGKTAADAAADTATFWGSVDTYISNQVAWAVEAEVYTLDATNGQPTDVTAVTPGTGNGARTGEPLPWATQGLIRWRTGVFIGGRELVGRTFIPGMSQADSTTGKPGTSTKAGVNSACNTLTASANSEIVVWSRKNGAAYSALTGSMWASFAVLRSRRD